MQRYVVTKKATETEAAKELLNIEFTNAEEAIAATRELFHKGDITQEDTEAFILEDVDGAEAKPAPEIIAAATKKARKPRSDTGQTHKGKHSAITEKRVRNAAGFTLTCAGAMWCPDKAALDDALAALDVDAFSKAVVVPGRPFKPVCQRKYKLE